MAVPVTKLHSIARAASDDLRARVHFCPETGQIWLHEHRMLLVHAEAQALLRKELIDSLGMDRARGLLTRMGYASGLRDAELARTRAENCSDLEAFMTGPQLHTLEGIVHVTPVKLRARPRERPLLRRVPVGELLGRPVAPPPLRHPLRAGVLDADRLRLRLHLGLHGPADPVQGSRVRRHGRTPTAASSASRSRNGTTPPSTCASSSPRRSPTS